ncbi:MAG: hypothetical protein AMJ81_09365, partial [Phycisphaerae bacterium SM23_33]
MKTRTYVHGVAILAAVLAAGILLAPLRAHAAADPAAKPDAKKPDADKPGPLTEDQIDAILDNMTPDQIDNLVKEAATDRLKVERKQVIAEIVRFRKAYDLYQAGKHKEAAAAAKKLVNINRATYLSAAQHYLYAQALAKSGNPDDAVETCRDILENMPDRISFASASALEAAEMYEKMGRLLYAMQMYAFCVKNYALTIDKATAEKILKKVEEYTEIYKDPMGTLATMMGDVQHRLAKINSGKETQDKERKIVAILDDLIKTAEDQQGGSQSPSQGQQRGKRPGQGKDQQAGKKGGQQGQQGQQGGMNPTRPMQDSMLVPGAVKRPPKVSKTHTGIAEGDWAKLSPREQEQIQARMRKLISERYREIIRDYHSRLAE